MIIFFLKNVTRITLSCLILLYLSVNIIVLLLCCWIFPKSASYMNKESYKLLNENSFQVVQVACLNFTKFSHCHRLLKSC